MKKYLYILPMLGVLLTAACSDSDEVNGSLPSVTTLDADEITRSTAVLNGETSGAVGNMLTRGVCFSTSETVAFEDSKVSVLRGSGRFSVKTHELTPVTTYYMRAYAVMKDGTVQYGEMKSFTTSDFQLPSLEMLEPTDVRSKEFTLNARIVSEGDYPIASCGFVYSKSAGPEVDGDGCTTLTLDTREPEMKATAASLEIGTRYYARAFAATAFGTAYSDEIAVTTSDIAPADIAAVTVGGNTYTSLTLSTEITNPHGTVTSYGFCWSAANALPTSGDSSVELAGKAFSHTIDGLLPNTLIHIRAYAVNDAGLNYGDVLSVRTRTYDCGGNMAVVVPPETFHIGWLGDKMQYNEQLGFTPTYTEANDGVFDNTNLNVSVGRKTPPVPSQVVNLAPYRIAKYEVTNADYVEFLNLYKSATVKEGDYAGKELLFMQGTKITYDAGSQSWSIADDLARHPVVGVTWYGAYEFCRFFGGFLPSEAQWENAARGNVYSNDPSVPMYRYSGSNDLAEVAVYNSVETAEVGTKKPNQLGIYDMSGNAQEWTNTWYNNYTATFAELGQGSQPSKTCRGGRCQRGILPHFVNNSREAFNIDQYADGKNSYIGFRFCDAHVE